MDEQATERVKELLAEKFQIRLRLGKVIRELLALVGEIDKLPPVEK